MYIEGGVPTGRASVIINSDAGRVREDVGVNIGGAVALEENAGQGA